MDRYYIVEVKVREEFFYLLWQDDLFVLSDQDLLVCRSVDDLKDFISRNEILADETVEKYDLDAVMEMIPQVEDSEKCNTVLICWNLLSDLSRTLETEFLGDNDREDVVTLYEKLVLGSNIPALKNEEYHPVLSDEECDLLESIIRSGMELFQEAIKNRM